MLLRVTYAFSLCCAVLVAQPQDWTTAARQAQEAGDYRKAAQAYSGLLAREPNNPQLLSNMGIMCYLAGEDHTALRSLRRALQLSPTLIPANLFTGLSLVRLNQPGEALPYLRRAHDADTRALLPLLGLAKAHVALRKYRSANDYYFRAVQVDERSAEAWLGLGITYRSLLDSTAGQIGQIDPDSTRAKRELSGTGGNCTRADLLIAESATAQGQRSLTALISLASCYQSLALSALNRAMELDPNSFETHLMLGEAFSEKKEQSAAIRECQAAIRIRPDDPAAHLALTTAYWTEGDFEHAAAPLKKVLELSPRDPDANAMMADMLVREGEFQKARPFALCALKSSPGLAVARVSLAKVLLAEGRPADAVEELKKAIHKDTDGSYYYMLYQALLRLGREEEANGALAKFRERRALFRK